MPTNLSADQQKALAKERKKYLLIILVPVTLIVLELIFYTLASSLLASWLNGKSGTVFNLILSLVALITVALIFLFGLLGVVGYVNFKVKLQKMLGSTSYQNLPLEELIYLNRPSLAGLLGSPIFALLNRLYWWAIIPILSWTATIVSLFYNSSWFIWLTGLLNLMMVVVAIILLIFGRELAWKKNNQSAVSFKKRQKIISILAIVFLVVMAAVEIFFSTVSYGRQMLETQKTMEQVNNVESVGTKANAEAFAKVLEQKGLKIKNQATFEQAINQGLTDGAALADLSSVLKNNNTDFIAGYTVGYAAGCLKTKGDDTWCQQMVEEKLKNFK